MCFFLFFFNGRTNWTRFLMLQVFDGGMVEWAGLLIDVDGYGFMVAVDDFFVIRSLWKGRDRAAVERIGCCCWCSFSSW